MTLQVRYARKFFPATKRITYLFNGGTCLCPTVAQEAVRNFLIEVENGFNDENWEKWINDANSAYSLFGDLIGATREEIVGIPNTSTGTNMIALMLNPKSGANVVIDDLEYNTVYPFTLREKKGLEIRKASNVDGYIDLIELESLVDDNTSAIIVSSVSCWNGYRYNLKELSDIAHKHDTYLVVDAAQQVGAVKLDVKREGVDFLATCGHKWLLAPPGTGFLYIRKDLISQYDPPLPGWMSITEPGDFEVWKPHFPETAQRLETGMPNFMLLAAAKATLDLIQTLGPDNIEKEILKRTSYLIEKLHDLDVIVYTPREREHRAGLVTFLLHNHEALYNDLVRNSIITFHHPENVRKNMHWPTSGLRVDPTFFNTMEELDDLLGYVKKHAS